LSDVFRKTLG